MFAPVGMVKKRLLVPCQTAARPHRDQAEVCMKRTREKF